MPEGFGFKAWISTEDGVALPEYGVETDEENKVITCWIPSEAGKKFKVNWNNLEHQDVDTVGTVKLDGTRVRTTILCKGNLGTFMDSVIISPTSFRKFVFSPLRLTDDVSLLSGALSGQHIGSISLELEKVKVGEVIPCSQHNINEQSTFHEKYGKGLVHKVGFAPEEESSATTTHRNVTRLQSFGTFVFKYRPLDVLQANGIAPAPKKRTSKQVSESSKKKADYKKKGGDKYGDKMKKTKDVRVRVFPSHIPIAADDVTQSGSKRKLDDIKQDDDDEEAKEKELERLRARIRKLEREQELEELRERVRELEDS